MPLLDPATIKGPVREALQLGQWHDGRTPDDGPPDAVFTAVVWSEDGREITDPARLAVLEAKYRMQYEEAPDGNPEE